MRGAIPSLHGRRSAAALASVLVFVTLLGGSSSAVGSAYAPVTLPDLTLQVPTDQISVGTDPSSGDRLLRFTHVTADTGAGPFELDPTYDPTTGTAKFSQMIYNSPSSGDWQPDHSVPIAVTANWNPPDDYTFPLIKFTLNKVDGYGLPGPVVATSPKTDFCMTGDTLLSGVPNTPDQSYIPPDNCADPTHPLGWSVGWGDEYDETDSGQPIDLTGIPDGIYVLHGIVDPEHVLTESNVANNVTDTELQITGDTVTVLSQTNPDSTPPSIAVTSPGPNDHVSGTVTLGAAPVVNPSTRVVSVHFLLDGQPVGTPLTNPPYKESWSVGSTPLGPHDLSAQVTDTNGNVSTAQPVRLTIVPGAGRGLAGGFGQTQLGWDQITASSGKKSSSRLTRDRGRPTLRTVRWRRGVLTVYVSRFPKRAHLSVSVWFSRHRFMRISARRGWLRLRTPRPRVIALRMLVGKHQLGRTIVGSLNSRPQVRITNPTSREVVSGVIPVVASAWDDMAVSAVHFAVDGRRIGTATAYPYAIHWRTTGVRPGIHHLSVVATDPSGNRATTEIAVNVENPRPPMTCFVLQAHVRSGARGSTTTPAFHTAMAGEVLFALVSAGGPSAAHSQRATVGGAGLRWRLVKRANSSAGDSEIWTATAHRILARAKVTSRLARRRFHQTLTVIAMDGVAGAGSATGASGRGRLVHVSLKTRKATSLVFVVANARNRAATHASPFGWAPLDPASIPAAGDSFWNDFTNQPTGGPGATVTANVTTNTSTSWNVVAVELVNSGG